MYYNPDIPAIYNTRIDDALIDDTLHDHVSLYWQMTRCLWIATSPCLVTSPTATMSPRSRAPVARLKFVWTSRIRVWVCYLHSL